LTELATGDFTDTAEKLKTFQLAVEETEKKIEVLKRDNKNAYLQEVLSKQKKEAALVAFAIAEESCATLGGDEDPIAVAKKIVEEREKVAAEVAILDAEDDRIASLIRDGETDFDCR